MTAPSVIFSLLHDGVIVAHEWRDDALLLTVNILYLAEMLDPSFRALTVQINGARDLVFRTWPKAPDAAPAELTARVDLDAVLAEEPDILSATWNAETERTTVVMNQSSASASYCGGDLSFRSTGIIVRDPTGKIRPIADLDDIARRYWEAFGARSPST